MAPKTASGTSSTKKAAEDVPTNMIRISNNHRAPFYTRLATNFLHGSESKDGDKKEALESIVVSALGAAITTAVEVCALVESKKAGKINKVETNYCLLDHSRMPQIQIVMNRNPDYVPPPRQSRESTGAKKTTSTATTGQQSTAAKEKFADGPDRPDRLKTFTDTKESKNLQKKVNKVLKEGGKRGVEIEGASDMGGMRFFPTKVLEPEGDIEMMMECVKAMNEKCEPGAEERKGGSGNVGKIVASFVKDDSAICICTYVPPSFSDLDAKTWMTTLLKKLEVPSDNKEDFKWHIDNPVYSAICIKNHEEKGVFCVKLKDYVIQRSNDILIEKGLIPPFDDESEDECYGDDDFEF